MGREAQHDVPRGVAPAHRLARAGVTCSIATNNVRNPFTPYGDGSLVRMANLFANVAQLGREEDLEACLDMVTRSAARLMRCDERDRGRRPRDPDRLRGREPRRDRGRHRGAGDRLQGRAADLPSAAGQAVRTGIACAVIQRGLSEVTGRTSSARPTQPCVVQRLRVAGPSPVSHEGLRRARSAQASFEVGSKAHAMLIELAFVPQSSRLSNETV